MWSAVEWSGVVWSGVCSVRWCGINVKNESAKSGSQQMPLTHVWSRDGRICLTKDMYLEPNKLPRSRDFADLCGAESLISFLSESVLIANATYCHKGDRHLRQ